MIAKLNQSNNVQIDKSFKTLKNRTLSRAELAAYQNMACCEWVELQETQHRVTEK